MVQACQNIRNEKVTCPHAPLNMATFRTHGMHIMKSSLPSSCYESFQDLIFGYENPVGPGTRAWYGTRLQLMRCAHFTFLSLYFRDGQNWVEWTMAIDPRVMRILGEMSHRGPKSWVGLKSQSVD